MATAPYDQRRGTYRVFWFEGLKRRSRIVARLPKGTPEPKRRPPEVLRALAEAEEREIASRRDRPGDPERTVGQFLDAYRAYYAEAKAGSSLEEFDRAREMLGAKVERMPLSAFGRKDAVAHLDAIAGADLAPRTVRLRIALISGAWQRGKKRDEVKTNPWRDLDLPGLEEPDRPSWTPAEFAAVFGAARPWLRDVLTIGVHSGLRVGELIALRWGWVDWSDGRFGSIRVPAPSAKSGRSRRIPLHEVAHDTLAARFARDGDDGGPILHGQTGLPINTRHQVNRAIGTACRRAGLAEVTSHAMRRSFGRWAVLGLGPWKGRPIPIYVVSQILGHADIKTTLIYLALDDTSADDWIAGPSESAGGT